MIFYSRGNLKRFSLRKTQLNARHSFKAILRISKRKKSEGDLTKVRGQKVLFQIRKHEETSTFHYEIVS